MTSKRRAKPVFLKIVGLILSESYQKCRLFAERLHKHHKKKFLQPSITGLLDMDWAEYLHQLKRQVGGKTWSAHSVVVFVNDAYIGGEPELFQTFNNFFYKNPSQEQLKEHAQKEYVRTLNKDNLIYTWMEVSLGEDYMGTLLFQLRHDWLPRSAMWFTEFCTHERFSYRGTPIHRVCKNGWFQSGEMCNQRDLSLRSLDDESYCYKHDRRGILSYANSGKHTNRFQFFVTFGPAEWMDGKYVGFGRVVEGAEVLRRIENIPCTYERPDREIIITNCGLASVGLGRAIDPNLRLKGITVGVPHLHLEVFIEMLFEKFDQILFERLDEETKKLMVEGSWIADILWKNFADALSKKRPPVEDFLDPRDKSSQLYLTERFIAGLYSVQDIPDMYIRNMLNDLISQAIEASDAKVIARSVLDFLVNSAFDEATMREQVADGIVQALVQEVLKIIFGSEKSFEEFSVSVLSTPSNLKSSLHDFIKTIGLEGDQLGAQPSMRNSLVNFIKEVILEMVLNLEDETQESNQEELETKTVSYQN